MTTPGKMFGKEIWGVSCCTSIFGSQSKAEAHERGGFCKAPRKKRRKKKKKCPECTKDHRGMCDKCAFPKKGK